VFADGQFFTLEMDNLRLLSVDCGTGHLTMVHQYGSWSGTTAVVPYAPILCGDLILTGATFFVQALQPSEKSLRWNIGYKTGEFTHLWDYFLSGNSLYILVNSLLKRSHAQEDIPQSLRTGDYLIDETLSEFEMVELDCSTGKTLSRFGKDTFLNDTTSKIERTYATGEWEGKKLIFMTYTDDSRIPVHRLFGFDPVSKSVTILVEQLNHPTYSTKVQDIGHKPLVTNGAVFYSVQYPDTALGTLAARDLKNDKMLWHTETVEVPYAAAKDKLFTNVRHRESDQLNCRNAQTGELIWTRKLKRLQPFHKVCEVGVSNGRVYVLSSEYMRALDATNGEEIWAVQLESTEDHYGETTESIWSRISEYFHRLF
jgi:outer membrane protein assembly factor BamB